MNTENTGKPLQRPSLLQNWMSLTGLVIVIGGLFSFFLLFMLDAIAHFSNPYISILTWMVTPAFLVFGFILTLIGVLRARHKRVGSASMVAAVQIDLSRPRDRRILVSFVIGSLLFIMLSAVGSYNAFNFTESVQFCGETCHGVMKPELTTHDHGPHARVACVACHVGPGVNWFVRSKLSGSYQLYSVPFNKYPRPITTPIKNLRPARETCEAMPLAAEILRQPGPHLQLFPKRCVQLALFHPPLHQNWRQRSRPAARSAASTGTWSSATASNTSPRTPPGRRFPGCASPIPRASSRFTAPPRFTNDISQYEIRTMDCMDCHNRPSHRYVPPDQAVNLAMELGQIDRTLPWIKTNAVYVLTRKYDTDNQARDGIATALAERYPNEPRIRDAIPVVQQIYSGQFLSRNEGQLERLSGQHRPHDLARLFPLSRRQAQGRGWHGPSRPTTATPAIPFWPRAAARNCSK